MKPIRFLASAREDLAGFPEEARRRAGHELFMLQVGRAPADFKTMRGGGPGVCEIRVREKAGAFRVLYVATFPEAIYVLHAFQKRSQKTSRSDLQLAARRYRMIGVQP